MEDKKVKLVRIQLSTFNKIKRVIPPRELESFQSYIDRVLHKIIK